MSRDACCLLNLSAIMNGFAETQATIGRPNKNFNERGQWAGPKTIYDRMSVMYDEHRLMPSYYQVEICSKQFK